MPIFAPQPMRLLRIRDFSGGLNLRDALAELAPNESPDLWNVTLDERGGVQKRLGQVKVNSTAFSGGLVSNQHYSDAVSDLITQAGASLYKGTTNTARLTFSSSARAGMCDFTGKVWAIHPVDGLYSSTNGTAWTLVDATVKGTSLAAWQNRLLACGDPSNPSLVKASGLGDGTDWLTTAGHGWTNQLRETKDGLPLLGFAAASGVDIAGRPGLIVCKRESTYRLYDSSNGAYQTLDPDTGAASPIAAITSGSRTLILSATGIFETDGISPLRKVSAKVDPLFFPASLAEDQQNLFAAGALGDRCYFSLPRNGETANDLALEYHTTEGWIAAGSNAASCYTTYGLNTHKLYAGSPTESGQVYEMFSGGSDDGADIASYFQTRWFEPSNGFLTRMRRLTPLCRGSFAVYTKTDFTTGQGLADEVAVSRGGFVWNDAAAIWNDPDTVWGPTAYMGYAEPIPSLGTCRSVSFRISETSSDTQTAPALLGTGAAPVVGAWGLAGLDLLYVQCGIAA